MALLIITHGSGQLGNRLIQFGNILAYAIEYNHILISLGLTDYQNLFSIFENRFIISYPLLPPTVLDKVLKRYRFTIDERIRRLVLGSPQLPIISKHVLDHELPYLKPGSLLEPYIHEKIERSRIVLLRGLKYQHPELVHKHREVIQNYFSLVSFTSKFQKEHLSYPLTIGLHIRHGDYQTWRRGKYFFTIEQYSSIIRTFIEQIKEDFSIKVYSNSEVDLSAFKGLPIQSSSGNIAEDLSSMAKCDYLIGPPSSFSFWASFIGQVPLYFIQHPTDVPTLTQFKVNTDLQYFY